MQQRGLEKHGEKDTCLKLEQPTPGQGLSGVGLNDVITVVASALEVADEIQSDDTA